jgi:hypothetical protein
LRYCVHLFERCLASPLWLASLNAAEGERVKLFDYQISPSKQLP